MPDTMLRQAPAITKRSIIRIAVLGTCGGVTIALSTSTRLEVLR